MRNRKRENLGGRLSEISTVRRNTPWTAWCLISLALLAGPAQAQLVLVPGETRANIAAAGRVVQETAGGSKNLASVTFDRADALTQNIRLHAGATSVLATTATARGTLFVDFCVPRAGATGCDTVSDPTAPDITANITFGYGVVGVVNALGPGNKATFQASGSVIDLERDAYINFQRLADVSASLGTVKTIAEVPIPIPDFDSAKTTLPVTFTTILRRGKVYRFQLAAAAVAQGCCGTGFFAESNFEAVSVQFPLQRGRVQLRNLTIAVSPDAGDVASALQELRQSISSLQGEIGNLAEQIETLTQQHEDDIAVLRLEIKELAGRTDIPGRIIMLPAGQPAPLDYTFVGTFDLAPSGGPRGRGAMMSVDVYRRNSP